MSRRAQAAEVLRRKRSDAFPGASGMEASVADINSTGPMFEPTAPPMPDAGAHEAFAGVSPEQIQEAEQALAEHEAAQAPQAAAAGPRPGSIPGQMQQAVMGAVPPPSPDDSELEAAQEADRKSRLTAGMELAARQLVGGITRTPVGQGIGAGPSEVPHAMERAKSRREQAAAVLARQRQERMDASTLDLQASEAEKNRRPPVVGKDNSEPTPYQKAMLEDRDLDRAAREADRARKAKAEEDKAARAAAAIRAKRDADAKKAGLAAETAKIPAFGGMFEPRAGTMPDKELAKQAATHAGLYNAAVSGMDGLSKAVAAFAAHPSPDTKREVDAQVSGVAAAVTAAHGGGAMADSEFERQKAALGADTMSAAGLQAVIESALGSPDGAKALLSKLKSSRSSLVEMAKGRLASSNYEFKAPGAAAVKPSPGPGYVRGRAGAASGWYNAAKNDWVAD